MNIRRIFGSAVIRKIAYILTGVALWAVLTLLGLGNARAHLPHLCQSGTCSKEEAYNAAVTVELAHGGQTFCTAQGSTSIYGGAVIRNQGANGLNSWSAYSICSNYGEVYINQTAFSYTCLSGRTWNETRKVCALNCTGGYSADPFSPGLCMDDAKCRALNIGLGTNPRRVFTGATFCPKHGCLMVAQAGTVTTVNGQGGALTSAQFEYSGASCPISNPPSPSDSQTSPLPPKPQECIPAGSDQTFCKKPNNDECYTAVRTGTQICWAPGQTGQKADGNSQQSRNPGPTEQPPNLTLPSGDTLVKRGVSVSTVTTQSGISTTTTTTNYTTVNGTTVGTPATDSGEPSNGTGSPPSAGDSNNSASGGVGCEPQNQPVVAGDPLLAMITLQTWATRCAVESKDAVTSTGEVGDCSTNFTVTGPPNSAEVIKLKGLREQICGVDKNLKDGDPTGPGSIDGIGLEGDASTTFIVEGEPQGVDGLNDAGYGFSRSCPMMPTINVFGTPIKFDNSVMCDWLRLGGMFVLALAALASLRILSGPVG